MKRINIFALLLSLYTLGCKENKGNSEQPITDNLGRGTSMPQREDLVNTYSEVPEVSAIIRAGDSGIAVYTLCQQRYTEQLAALKKESDDLGAKLIITILTPEIGEAVTASTRLGVPFIINAGKKQGIEVYDLTNPMAKYTSKQITQMPVDGHWSAAGAKIIAEQYQTIIESKKEYHSTKTFTDKERPQTFGDLDPNQDAALDGGKGIPYQLITNSQGLRMNYALTFPKTKQRILFLGDSQLYSPFLDNGQITTTLLQQQFPDKEIINAGIMGYTLDDHVALLAQKAKFTEPDIIVLVTNPNDVGDFYFSQRNRMSRSQKAYLPTSTEIGLYQKLFSNK